ncbi:MAG: LytR C-terminal domain-containing protein [Solirubrobacterales bacterium]|nr:LytR C-terminal domain-containing protein [Solirubrobacterales bacterium]
MHELEAELAALADHVAALPAEISVRAAGPRAPAYAVAPAPAPAGVSAVGANLPPAAPAGVGAPALAAATRLIPDPTRPIGQPQPVPVGLVNGPVEDATQVGSSPVTVGGNGSSHRPVPASAATMQRPVQSRPGGPRPGGPSRGGQGRYPGAQGRPRASQGRPAGAPQSMMSVRTGETRSGVGKLFVVLAALLGVAAVVAGVLVIKNVNSSSSNSKSGSTASAASGRSTASNHRTAPVVAVNPATVTVAVLNGTSTNLLASKVSQKLVGKGFQKGPVGNFTAGQTQNSTIVQYMSGDKRDASAVATALQLRPAAVQPIDQATQQIACPPAQGPCKSAVVVTVGSDLNSLATQ